MEHRTNRAVWTFVFALVGLGLLSGTSARAAGVGGYVEFGYSHGFLDVDGIGDVDYDSDRYGVGFVLDTNLSQDSLFNYRLTLGYQRTKQKVRGFGDVDANGFTMNNTFGFGVYRSPKYRLWLGPTIRLNVDVPDIDVPDVDVVDYGFGGGAQGGVNFHAGDRISLSLALGYAYMYVNETINSDVPNVESLRYDGGEHFVTVGISIFYRSPGDRFISLP